MAFRCEQLELQLQQALKVKPPEKLRFRILLKHSFEVRGTRWIRARPTYALAANLLLAVGLAAGLTTHTEMPSLEEAAFLHVAAHPQHDHWGKTPVGKETLATLLKPLGAEITGDVGAVTGASICAIREKLAAHLILEGEKASVAVLLMPEEPLHRRSKATRDELAGLFLPARKGAVAIVGAKDEPLEKVEGRIRSAVRWRL